MKPEHHEKVTVVLVRETLVLRTELHTCLKLRGFKSEDDFYSLKRKARVQPWETRTLVSVDVKLNSSAVDETEADIEEGASTAWNSLELSYLMASMPRDCIDLFVEEVQQLSLHFGLQIQFNSELFEASSLRTELNRIADELAENFGGTGSEELAILIEQEYAH